MDHCIVTMIAAVALIHSASNLTDLYIYIWSVLLKFLIQTIAFELVFHAASNYVDSGENSFEHSNTVASDVEIRCRCRYSLSIR